MNVLLRGKGRRRWIKQHWAFLHQLFLKLETISGLRGEERKQTAAHFCFVVEVSREMMS
jgi:hypothetical protein